MKNLILITSVFAFNLFASNAIYTIGITAQSKGMGGTGVANATNSSDATFKNPALLGVVEMPTGKVSVEVYSTLAKQNVMASQSGTALATDSGESVSGAKPLPSLGASYRIDPKMDIAISAFTYGGAVSDLTGTTTPSATTLGSYSVHASNSRFSPAFSYKVTPQFSFGVAPFLIYADLGLNKGATTLASRTTREPHGDVGYGAEFGVTVSPISDLIFGATFLPKSGLNFKQVYDLDTLLLTTPAGDGILDTVNIEEPMQFALGTAYKGIENLTLTLDYRFIGWSNADTYKDLGWNNQHVFAFGTQYKMNAMKFRLGFNWANDLIDNATGESGLATGSISGHTVSKISISKLNLVAFPGLPKSHFTAGMGYEISPAFGLDFAFVYAPKVTVTRSGTLTSAAATYSYTGVVSQWSMNLGGVYRF